MVPCLDPEMLLGERKRMGGRSREGRVGGGGEEKEEERIGESKSRKKEILPRQSETAELQRTLKEATGRGA